MAANSTHSRKQYLEQGRYLFGSWKGLEKNIHFQEGCALGCNICNIYLHLEDRFSVFHPLSQSCSRGSLHRALGSRCSTSELLSGDVSSARPAGIQASQKKTKKLGNVPVPRSRCVVYHLSQSMAAILSKHTWRLAYFPKWLLSFFFFFLQNLSDQVRCD